MLAGIVQGPLGDAPRVAFCNEYSRPKLVFLAAVATATRLCSCRQLRFLPSGIRNPLDTSTTATCPGGWTGIYVGQAEWWTSLLATLPPQSPTTLYCLLSKSHTHVQTISFTPICIKQAPTAANSQLACAISGLPPASFSSMSSESPSIPFYMGFPPFNLPRLVLLQHT